MKKKKKKKRAMAMTTQDWKLSSRSQNDD